ncbi:hypothetical protein ACFXBB_35500 [Streptomyces scopuliridis]|uniref:hypothetical protein n=1 Tax=Streptomyces scopuliridis TaxID=452529 RepID=UPI0036796DBA
MLDRATLARAVRTGTGELTPGHGADSALRLFDLVRRQALPEAGRDLVAAHGAFYEPAPFPHGDRRQPGQCFRTASEWAEPAGWPYVEGFVLVPSAVPFSCFEHAWCLTDDGVRRPITARRDRHTFRREQQALRGTDAVFASDPKNPLAGINEAVLSTGLLAHAIADHSGPPVGA